MGTAERELDVLTGTAVWDHPGRRVPVRWVLVRDVVGEHDPQAFLCTDLEADALDVLRWFVRRWAVEVDVRRGPAPPRRRDPAPVVRQGHRPHHAGPAGAVLPRHPLGLTTSSDAVMLGPRCAAGIAKRHLTFSDALGAVRRQLWEDGLFQTSGQSRDMVMK